MIKHSMRDLITVSLTVSAVAFGTLVAEAQTTINVSIDHNQYWGAYQTCSS